ncbi:unnamed protein product [Clonostachys rosea]|uniref:Prion-inhibition and propagation HeLo domain-containing protein n=1 Tax=Bionectria ochroleuca TaxID=29856 RepID=A0ABY6U981_BIOOC|nr:unnamed protein product [Clonostachys rosea]
MEPVGLAVGVVGLVGLFNTCLETVARVDAYKEFGSDSRALAAQFQANRLLFERWGRSIELEQGRFPDRYHPSLDDQSVLLVVTEIISMIRNIFSDVGKPDDAPATKSTSLARGPTIPSGPSTSKRHKIALDGLVRKLYELVPIEDANKEAEIDATSSDPFRKLQAGTESWAKDIQDTLKKIEQDLEAETRRELHAWIGADIPSDVYNDIKEIRVPGTCDWILDRPEFRDWLVSNENSVTSPVLWFNATAGFGKTILCARVIEYLSETLRSPIAHFFLSSKDASRDDPYLAIRSWLIQIMGQNTHAFNLVRMKRLSQHEQTASRMTIISLFQEIVQTVPDCTFVLDGLDECVWVSLNHQKHDSIKVFLQVIGEAIEGYNSRFMLVSRNDDSIRNSLRNSLTHDLNEIRVVAGDVHGDIISYSKTIVNERLSNKPQDLREDISQQLANQCDGQFLWVRLQAAKLRKISNKFQLQRDISNTPAGLEQLYEREWESISTNPDVDTARALSLLKWAAFSIRPLSVSEIAVAVLIRHGCPGVPLEELSDSDDGPYIIEDIKAHSGSLLEITAANKSTEGTGKTENTDSMVVQLTHFSVKEFIFSTLLASDVSLKTNSAISASYEQRQHSALAEACLQYIFHLPLWEMKALPKEAHGLEIAFLDYAAGGWSAHLHRGSDNAELNNLIAEFFDDQTGVFDAWRRGMNLRAHDRGILPSVPGERNQTNRLSYAIALRLQKTTDDLLTAENCDVNGRGVWGETPLIVSCKIGQVEIAKRLLSSGADILSDVEGGVPLCMAADRGHVGVARVLLEAGADVDVRDVGKIGQTPLLLASFRGHLEMAKLLVDNEADVSLPDMLGNTPLLVAVREGHLQVAQLLVNAGADVNVSSNGGHSPLLFACMKSNVAIAELLIDKGADISAVVGKGGSLLHAAASRGHLEVAKLLLNKGAQVDCLGDSKMTPLYRAVNGGHLRMTELLIDKGADLTLLAKGERSLLHVAAVKGHLDITRLLIREEEGLLLAQGRNEGGPMISALRDRHSEVTRLSLENEPTMVTRADIDGWTPLHVAALDHHLEICQALLEKGADPSCQDKYGNTPLHFAASDGHLGVVKLFLEREADLEIVNNFGQTPLFGATVGRNLETVKILVEKGASIHTGDNTGTTPLHAACDRDSVEIVDFLLGRPDINPDALDLFGRPPLSDAARCGYAGVVKMLIDRNARVDIADRYDMPPLFYALRNGHAGVVELLLPKTPGWKDWHDSLGRDLIWWARHVRSSRITQLLIDHGADIESCQSEDGVADIPSDPKPLFRAQAFCDRCIGSILRDTQYYLCGICAAGGFCVCVECFEGGLTCFDDSHDLTFDQH